jgi:hypothetical protein
MTVIDDRAVDEERQQLKQRQRECNSADLQCAYQARQVRRLRVGKRRQQDQAHRAHVPEDEMGDKRQPEQDAREPEAASGTHGPVAEAERQ